MQTLENVLTNVLPKLATESGLLGPKTAVW